MSSGGWAEPIEKGGKMDIMFVDLERAYERCVVGCVGEVQCIGQCNENCKGRHITNGAVPVSG